MLGEAVSFGGVRVRGFALGDARPVAVWIPPGEKRGFYLEQGWQPLGQGPDPVGAVALVDPCNEANINYVCAAQAALGLLQDGKWGSETASAARARDPNAPSACHPRPAWWPPPGYGRCRAWTAPPLIAIAGVGQDGAPSAPPAADQAAAAPATTTAPTHGGHHRGHHKKGWSPAAIAGLAAVGVATAVGVGYAVTRRGGSGRPKRRRAS